MDETVLVTGASGYIARHIVTRLLAAGYRVRGYLRRLDQATGVRAAIGSALPDTGLAEERLDFVQLDLTSDDGWPEALSGADALIHTASPVDRSQGMTAVGMIGTAVDGTMRALRAAARSSAQRVVMTSSIAAVVCRNLPLDGRRMTEDDWSNPDHPACTPYGTSKTLAEQAAWRFVETEAPHLELTAVNPALSIGPPIGTTYGNSLGTIANVLRKRGPLQPRVGFCLSDVRDIAEMHLRALQRPETAGKRYLGAGEFLWFSDIARLLNAARPDLRLSTRVAPDILLRGLALVDPSKRGMVPSLGRRTDVSNQRARTDLGIDFIPVARSLKDSADWLIEQGYA